MSLFVQPDFLDNRPRARSALFALVALSLVALPLAVQLPAGVVAVFAVLMLVRIALLKMGVFGIRPWQNAVLLAGTAFLVLQQLGTIFGLQGGIAFLLLLALLKSYEGKTRRDWQVLVLSMLFLLTGAVLFDEGLLTGLWVLFCLILMAVTLALLNDVGGKMALRQSLTGFALTLLPMALLFVAMPRRDSPLWGVPQNPAKGTTGMSDTMQPGSIGELVLDNRPAFSATFANGYRPQQSELYWRVSILGATDGTSWHATTDFIDSAIPRTRGRIVGYQIIAEDDKGRLPLLDYPLLTEKTGYHQEAGDVLRVVSRQGLRRIDWQSNLENRLPQALNYTELAYYTRLPEGLNPKTAALAAQLKQQSGGSTEALVSLAYRYFAKQNFRYTLRPPVLESRHRTDEFIFTTKQGFCEHYADAFTTLIRAAGIPARVVIGYQGGEYNVQGGFWQIRSKDAHAWTEVWLPEEQAWMRVDPTAAAAAARVNGDINDALPDTEAGALVPPSGFLTTVLDQGRFYWQQWIVNYDNDRQQNLFGKLGLGSVNPLSILILLLIGTLPALLPVWLWWRRSRRYDIRPLDDGFMLLKHRLLGKDYPNAAALGPVELQTELAESGRLVPDLDSLIRDYIRLNFAARTPPDKREARAWYARAAKLSAKYRLKTAAPPGKAA